MNTNYSKAIHFVKIFTYKLKSYLLSPNHLSHLLGLSCPPTHAPLKVYTYDLPAYYQKNDDYDLDLVYGTFLAIRYFFVNCVATSDPHEADYFFVPLNLHSFQVKNIDPASVIQYCKYLGKKKDHLLIATGDFSQRDGHNHYGSAYTTQYPWLKQFKLLALESSDDLIPNQDLGIIPFNTLVDQPLFNDNCRPYLYSFIGETNHAYLPKSHIRHRLKELQDKPDIFIGKSLSKKNKVHTQCQF